MTTAVDLMVCPLFFVFPVLLLTTVVVVVANSSGEVDARVAGVGVTGAGETGCLGGGGGVDGDRGSGGHSGEDVPVVVTMYSTVVLTVVVRKTA